MIPLYGFLEGDTIGLLILAYPQETLEEVREKLKIAASVRVKPKPHGKFIFNETELDLKLPVSASGLTPLDRFEVKWQVK